MNIDTSIPYDTAEQGDEAVRQLLEEQKADKKALMNAHYESLVSSVLDLDTDDQISAEPTLYNYVFKSKYYTPEQVLMIQ